MLTFSLALNILPKLAGPAFNKVVLLLWTKETHCGILSKDCVFDSSTISCINKTPSLASLFDAAYTATKIGYKTVKY